ncbi:hypothetical protein [Streptomyces sp. NPDC056190]|uniref:hypothetical protein n=1 Tax=Streptomyces sp. NPDC056190 TaxID=3345741 RepID=UPI0035D81EA8
MTTRTQPPGTLYGRGVVDEVGGQALPQPGVARGRCRCGSRVHVHLPGVAVPQDRPGDLGEVERLAPVQSALAAGEHQQRLDEAFLVFTAARTRSQT